MFSSPIFYSRSTVNPDWQFLYTLNPMTGVIEGFRWAVLGRPVDPYVLVSSFLVSSILIFTGMVYFRYTERRFADLI
jgi:lipopolysaccharide transport system permease protein